MSIAIVATLVVANKMVVTFILGSKDFEQDLTSWIA